MTKNLRLSAICLFAVLVAPLTACEPSIFDVERFGEIHFNVDLTGIPDQDAREFRIHWQHVEWEDIERDQEFRILDPPNDYEVGLLEQIPVGEVRVSLSQLPPNCSVEDREKTVTVRENEASSLTFTVACD